MPIRCGQWRVFVAVLGQVVHSEPSAFFLIVGVHETSSFIIAKGASLAEATRIAAPSGLHTPSRLYAAYGIRCNAIVLATSKPASIWVTARKIEEVDSSKDCKEPCKERDSVYGIRGVESTKENK